MPNRLTPVIAGVEVLVEDVGSGIVLDAGAEIDHRCLGLGAAGGLKVDRQGNHLGLDDQMLEFEMVAVDRHGLPGIRQQLIGDVG